MEFKVTVTLKIVPSEISDHSYIVENQEPNLTGEVIKYGPIPDVLVNEVLHELQESRRILFETLIEDWKRN